MLTIGITKIVLAGLLLLQPIFSPQFTGLQGTLRSGVPDQGECADVSSEADVAEYAEANGLDEDDSIYVVCTEAGRRRAP